MYQIATFGKLQKYWELKFYFHKSEDTEGFNKKNSMITVLWLLKNSKNNGTKELNNINRT